MKVNFCFLSAITMAFLCVSCFSNSQIKSGKEFIGNETLTYEECITAYKKFSEQKFAHLIEFGKTDVGKPLHLFLLSKDYSETPKYLRSSKPTLLINNAIHPGEPCGVDASVLYVENLITSGGLDSLLSHVNLGIIPMYNIGGGLNRGCCSRANQNGPAFYGFRGNGKNLDLNRDFIKTDSENAMGFTRIFQFLNPHVFLDTHTSNGADYQHVMTLITTQPDKTTPPIRSFLNNTMVDELYSRMELSGFPMAPYVHTFKSTPDEGIKDYLETPRYSTGYATLFNCLGFVSETHMLKDYSHRVMSTYELINHLVNFTSENAIQIIETKKNADKYSSVLRTFEINWELDTTRFDLISFKGYSAGYKKSDISENERLYYDRSKPFEKEIKYYNRYSATERVKAPEYYIIPQSWKNVIERFELNEIYMEKLSSDSSIMVEFYYLDGVTALSSPYEGHYFHKDFSVRSHFTMANFKAGDYLVPVNQVKNRYIVETLEPKSVDSFFRWNFFDSVLQQKEWFSPYVFEDKAAEILKSNPQLKAEFEKKQVDESFKKDQWGQLYWIYTHSDYYEPTHNRYPIARINYSGK